MFFITTNSWWSAIDWLKFAFDNNKVKKLTEANSEPEVNIDSDKVPAKKSASNSELQQNIKKPCGSNTGQFNCILK